MSEFWIIVAVLAAIAAFVAWRASKQGKAREALPTLFWLLFGGR